MNALVVAPRVNLPWAEQEAQYVHNLLGGRIVSGQVTIRDILDVADDGAYNILWFCSHANDEGVELSDDRLPYDVLAQVARKTKAKLVFLNACSTERVAQGVYSIVRVPVVCTVGDVEDTTAYFTGRVFADNVNTGTSITEAFRNSKTKSFVMIPEAGETSSHLASQVYTNRDDISEIRSRIRSLEDIIADIKTDREIQKIDRASDLRDRDSDRILRYATLALIVLILAVLVRNTILLNQLQGLL